MYNIFFQPAESLWQLLEDWLNLLQIEFDQKTPTCKQSSTSLDGNNSSQSQTNGSPEMQQKMKDTTSSHASQQVKPASDKPCDTDSYKRLRGREDILKHMSLDDQDVIGATLPRICGVVQAFYITCACHTQTQ